MGGPEISLAPKLEYRQKPIGEAGRPNVVCMCQPNSSSRGEIACAECRRLKIRCDRIVPCTTCVKRGCGALCPNGTIPPGEGSRFVLAATDHLHRKLARLEGRMRSLEDALAIVQANTSDRPHPLLVTPLEEVDDEPRFKPIQEDRFEDRSDSPADLVDGLGTLIMDERGSSRFFGPTGGSEVRRVTFSSRTLLQELDPSYLPPEINHYYQAFPFPPTGFRASPVQSMIESFLPSVERAIALCGTFLEHLSWMFNIVTRQHVVGELIPAVYKQSSDTYGPHDLALLLIVLGIGSLVDLTLEPYNLEAQHYYRLTRAAMSLQPVLAEQSMVTIKVLHLMSIYNGMSGKESNLEQSYTLLDLAGQVALRIGFHIDPSMWGIEGREAYDRRVYFWNLMAGVTWQSLVTGRPPALLISYVNCRIPSAEDESRYQAGEVPLGFGIWGFKASADCLIPVVRATLAAKPPEYSAVLDLDQKIRSFASPKPDDAKDERIAISMRNFVRAHYQDLILLFLHRGFFAQAMSENPQDPLRSKYGHSVTAAYASSCTVLSDIRGQFSKKPLLCGRIWRMWSYAFSAAIVVGTIAIRGSHLNLQPPAFHEFELTCETFRQAAEISNRAARAMVSNPLLSCVQNSHCLPANPANYA
ncbi:hypothetical protein BDN72DRAFT_757359 [Pluteus cervinus]|uniref:Uncharacterized protein n=1 Tax=Pluteus cervinus TaxID=181527 RepID=A0ACD3BC98_9AGAR|nr:hypothetical protein BDN72DRAFT_757359 [Pluteus cervinus]